VLRAGNNPGLSASIPDVLGLASCNLTGPIPTSLARLAALTALNLQQNALSEAIPRGLAGLASLQVLALASNQHKILQKVRPLS
jgi:Leucine-rich repeat (LRR) protein